ncbi:FmdB family zinc ribbon protein [Rubritalea tangerina]|uniref:Zinc ribbon domain-containing protein n=1 Tax=Rubritalea tangerina TaxID=430798 RepID=A0ABW4Z798_9BACT
MSDPDQHHCDSCNAIFSADSPLSREASCPDCGESPFRKADFTSIDQMQRVVQSDDHHGVPGLDVADFVSMQKVRRRRQGRMAIALWVILLVGGVGFAIYNQQLEEGEGAEENQFVKAEREYQQTLLEEGGKCLKNYDRFLAANSVNERSSLVVGGVRKILSMEKHAEDIDAVAPAPPLELLGQKYESLEGRDRVEFLVRDGVENVFELVFWEIDGEWLLDWEQHVRYSEKSWSNFLAEKPDGARESFRLYVRRRHVGSGRSRAALQLIFYQPKVLAGERLNESPQVVVEMDDPLYGQLNEAFDKLEALKNDDERVIGAKDTAGLLRVHADLEWRPGEEAPELHLSGVRALDWMEPGLESGRSQ